MFNLRSLDLNLLTVFEAVHELGSVSAAAERLALSQSATSHAVSRLREVCNDALFVRATRGLSPTPIATAMYPAIKQALEALRTSLAQASGFDPAQSDRHFRISIPHPMGPFYALVLREAAARAAPAATLRFDTVSRPTALEDLLRDGIVDLAVDWLPATLDSFVNKKLFEDRLAILVRPGHPRVRPGTPPEALLDEDFVGLHRRRALEQLPSALREFAGLGVRETIQVDELLEIPAVVACTDLLGVFPTSMTALVQERLGLQVFATPTDLPTLPIHMIWHETRRNDHGHRWLREFIATELRRISIGALLPVNQARAGSAHRSDVSHQDSETSPASAIPPVTANAAG